MLSAFLGAIPPSCLYIVGPASKALSGLARSSLRGYDITFGHFGSDIGSKVEYFDIMKNFLKYIPILNFSCNIP